MDLTELSKKLSEAFQQQNRAQFIKNQMQMSRSNNHFAYIFFCDNLIVFKIGCIFETVNILHQYTLSKMANSGKYYTYDLPNFDYLLNNCTLGSVVVLAESGLSDHDDLLVLLKQYSKKRNILAHKMFDTKKVGRNRDIRNISEELVSLGSNILKKLDQVESEVLGLERNLRESGKKGKFSG